MPPPTRKISWIRVALRDFQTFPMEAQEIVTDALAIAAHGQKASIAKPLRGLGSDVLEIALAHRGNAYRVVYALQLDADIWVIHAFQKKSTHGIKTPKKDIDLIRERIKRLTEQLR